MIDYNTLITVCSVVLAILTIATLSGIITHDPQSFSITRTITAMLIAGTATALAPPVVATAISLFVVLSSVIFVAAAWTTLRATFARHQARKVHVSEIMADIRAGTQSMIDANDPTPLTVTLTLPSRFPRRKNTTI